MECEDLLQRGGVDADNMIDTELDAFWTGFLLTRMAENIHSRWKILKICSPQRQRRSGRGGEVGCEGKERLDLRV